MTKLIIGLGNPGSDFKATPHNFGFQFVDDLKKHWQGPNFKLQTDLRSEVSILTKEGTKIILAKPQTFMNKSGLAALKLQKYFQISLQDLWVIHDDIDISLGRFKIVCNHGAAGHKGVLSIIESLGSQDFCRLRLGARTKQSSQQDPKDFVLKKLKFSQRLILRKTFQEALLDFEKKFWEN